ncbi:exported hypothetical protein [Rhodococcus ruber]|uniref:Uncharacterized protein n=1 Tax=Rhodococcus ruber TaxID=1830 RepID=A0A098BWR8_9NOCA|nr:exported hypothetical protein [Rhodococcus ruber]
MPCRVLRPRTVLSCRCVSGLVSSLPRADGPRRPFRETLAEEFVSGRRIRACRMPGEAPEKPAPTRRCGVSPTMRYANSRPTAQPVESGTPS